VVIVYALGGFADQTSLSANLRGDFVVRKTGGGENGNFLSTGNRVHGVNGGDTGRNHFFGINLRAVSRIASVIKMEYLRESTG